MLGFQPTDLIGILIVALLIFGPSRLPQIGRALGSTMRELQNATREATQSLKEEVSVAEPKPEEQSTPSTVPCINCGKPLTPGAKFCTECGAAQQVEASPS